MNLPPDHFYAKGNMSGPNESKPDRVSSDLQDDLHAAMAVELTNR